MLFELPEVVLQKILKIVSVKDLCSLEMVQKRTFSDELYNKIWFKKIKKDFGESYDPAQPFQDDMKRVYKIYFRKYHEQMETRKIFLAQHGINMEHHPAMSVELAKSNHKKAMEKHDLEIMKDKSLNLLVNILKHDERNGLIDRGTAELVNSKDISLVELKKYYITYVKITERNYPEPIQNLIETLNRTDDNYLTKESFNILCYFN